MLGLGTTISKTGRMPTAVAVAALLGDMPYTKAMASDGVNDYMFGATSAAGGSQDVSRWSDFDICDDADAPWSIEMDVLVRADANSYEYPFQLQSGGMTHSIHVQPSTSNDTQLNIRYHQFRYDGTSSNQYRINYNFTVTAAAHFTVNTNRATWHRITITKGTSLDLRDMNIYLNGTVASSLSPYKTGASYDFNDTGSWAGSNRYFYLPMYNDRINIGMFAFYNKELSNTEINEHYDNGARLGGSADEAEIMVQDPRESSTASNLKYYIFYDAAVDDAPSDADAEMKAKVGSINFRFLNGMLVSQAVPQIPYLSPSSTPVANYATESVTFTQAVSTSGTVVKWYSDSGFTSLLSTGTDYSFTVPSAGAQTLFAQETKTWPSPYGAVAQGVDMSYTSYNAGHSTHSYVVNGYPGESDKTLTSPTMSALNDSTNDGDFCFTGWFSCDAAYTFRPIMYASNGAGGTYQFSILGAFSSYPMFVLQSSAGTYYWYASGAGSIFSGLSNKDWVHITFAWDVSASTAYCFANGVNVGTVTNAVLGAAFGENGDPYINILSNWSSLKIANFAVYDELLTVEEMAAINTSGTPGSSLDLASLSSASKIHEYWKINGDSYSDGAGDVIEGENGVDIPVADSVAGRKSIDRP